VNKRTKGYTPLQVAVIFGKMDILVYLLARGADPMLESASSVVDMARLRQQRLLEALERSGDGAEFEGFSVTRSEIEPMVKSGEAMVDILEGVKSYGSFSPWAKDNGHNPLVRRFSNYINFSECRYEMVLLRALVTPGRATLHSDSARAAIAAELAVKAAKKAKDEQPLFEALKEAGFLARQAKDIRDTFRTPTVISLKMAKLSDEYVESQLDVYVRSGRMSEGERRRMVRFVRDLDQPEEPAPAPKPSAKKSAKSKAAPAAALMALSAKGAGKAGYPKAAPAKKKASALDGIAMFFTPDLPDSAFMLVTKFLFCN